MPACQSKKTFVGRFYGLDTDVQETSVRFVTKGTGGNAADLHNASDAYLMHGISNGDTKFVFGANGNVGIGTTNPTATLDVNGKVALGSSVYDSNGNTGTSGQVLSSVPGIGVSWTDQTGGSGGSGSGSGTIKVAILSEEQSSGTNGGEFSSGSWLDRTLNTIVDPQSIVTFSSSNNYFALEAGSYKINWSAPAHAVDSHQTKLVYADNISFNSSSEILGTSEACHDPLLEGNNLVQTRSFGETVITITETTYFKVQHRCTDTKSDTGFGVPSNFGVNEVYTQISVQDLSSAGGSGGSGGSSDPVGTIVAWSGSFSSIPSEYQLCDGSAAQTTELQAITGANVPDLRSRFIVGAANTTGTGSWPNVGLGSTGGSADATLVSHSHTTNSTIEEGSTNAKSLTGSFKNENHSGGTGNYATGIFNVTNFSNSHNEDSSQGTGGPIVKIDATHRHTTDSQGNSATNANLPPYYALFYIIKHTATSGSGSGSGGGGIELLSPKTATGTSVEFTDIPADAKEIKLMFSEVGVGNTTNHLLVQLGTSSGWINTGYYASSEAENGMNDVSASDGFPIHNRNDTDATGNRFTGFMIINLFKTSPSKTYTQIGQFKRYNTSDDCEDCSSACQTYGNVDSISGDITRIRVLANHTGSGQSFTNGEINVSCNSGGSGGGSLIKLGTVATNTGTEAAFTSIPSTAKKITVAIHNFGVDGSGADVIMQVGDSSGYSTSGYQSSFDKKDQTSNTQSRTDGYGVIVNADAGLEYNATIELVNVTGNSWTISHTGGSSSSDGEVIHGGGSKSLLNSLDRLKVFDASGANLDHGHITVYYENQGGSGSGSSSGITIQDEGSDLSNEATTLNFVGAGVTSSGTGTTKTITIDGGGGFVTGMIMMFSGTTAPSGWVLCDNSTEAQAANAPDLRDRFIVGTGNSYNLNATGGSANAVLIGHSHTYNRPNTSTNPNGGAPAGDPGEIGSTFGSYSTSTVGVNTAGNSSTSQTGTNANLPPYYALAFIMKT